MKYTNKAARLALFGTILAKAPGYAGEVMLAMEQEVMGRVAKRPVVVLNMLFGSVVDAAYYLRDRTQIAWCRAQLKAGADEYRVIDNLKTLIRNRADAQAFAWGDIDGREGVVAPGESWYWPTAENIEQQEAFGIVADMRESFVPVKKKRK